MNEAEQKIWHEGVEYGKTSVLVDLFRESDKRIVLKACFRKAAKMAEQEPERAAEWEAYSEGFRHALNVLDNLGTAINAYNGVINPSIRFPLVEEDLKGI